MKKSIGVLIIGLLLIAINTGCTNNNQKAVSNSNTKDTSNVIEAYGTVKASDVKNIVIDFPASVANINIKEGERVKKNNSLVQLDLTEYKRQIESKQNEFNVENMSLQKSINSVGSDQAELEKLQGDLSKLESELNDGSDPNIKKYLCDLKNARDAYNKSLEKLNRLKTLYDAGSISKDEVRNFQDTVNANKKNVDDLELSLEDYKEQKLSKIDDLKLKISQKFLSMDKVQAGDTYTIKMQKEKVSGIEKELESMNQKLNKSFIKGDSIISDVDNGVVSDIGYSKGDILKSEKKVLSLFNLDSLYIEANVAEEFISDVKVGADVDITPVSNRGKLYKGKVRKIMQKAQEKDGETTILVEIDIKDKGDLMPNFNVDLKIKR